MKVTFRAKGIAAHYLVDVESIVPPSNRFPYWAIYLSDSHVVFKNMYYLDSLEIEGGEVDESVDGTQQTVLRTESPKVHREKP